MRISIVDTFTSMQGFDGEVIPVSEVPNLLSKIHDILDKAFRR